ncbi:hypothetical protein B0H11DRAFT_2247757 [Mycena galericulata]|nr:hypothetical protein B0H11DRAFT_2247757 [Mycena galericulata]
MSDPPEYEDNELAQLIAGLSDLELADLERPRTPPRPSTPSPRLTTTPHVAASAPGNLYEYHSPTKSGRTTDWGEAAHYSQGVPGGSVQNVGKPVKHRRPKPRAYAVFFGRQPGPYLRWSGANGASAQVTGVSAAIHQGYASQSEAEAAFAYAQTRGWTGTRPNGSQTIPTPINSVPTPVVLPSVSFDNPLHGIAGCDETAWYVVYAGITPGIYRSVLECSLNTLGLPSAAHQSCASREEAQQRWENAKAAGHIRVLTPMYSP